MKIGQHTENCGKLVLGHSVAFQGHTKTPPVEGASVLEFN